MSTASTKRFKLSLLAFTIAACSVPATFAATAESDKVETEEITVTGFRKSLETSAEAKKEAVGFTDAIFADDIGKMPSQNLAESLNRIPGVKINREVTGEGLQISVRGLGASYTKVNLNGNNISVASDGALGAGNRGREVDLGMFPTELFSSLSVSKSADASQMEGGITGYVNMRTARAFDREGRQINFSLEGAYTEINEEISPKGSFIYSNTWDDKFGVLVGLTTSQMKSRVDGYETVGYTDGCVVAAPTSSTYSCASGQVGRNQIQWNPRATADYAATHAGVNVGDTINVTGVAGVSATALDHALFPYLGRAAKIEGQRDANTELVSLEYRPQENMSLVLDVMATQADRDFNRIDTMLWARRTSNQANAMIIENAVVDSNEVLREATLYNSSFWVEASFYNEKVNFTSVMPSFSWQINDEFKMDLSASRTDSDFVRERPTWLYTSPKGITHYKLGSNGVPTFSFSVPNSTFDLNGTTGWSWGGGGAADAGRYNEDRRDTKTNGFHADFALGESPDKNGIKFGFAYDTSKRFMEALGNSSAHSAAIYANAADVNQFLNPMSGDFGNTLDGAGVGFNGWAQIDYSAIKSAYDYRAMVNSATRGGDAFGQTVGDIDETYKGVYFLVNGESEVVGRNLRTNFGVRYTNTDQWVGSWDTSKSTEVSTESKYAQWLPSFSAVYDLTDSVKLRTAASRGMTRANPADMFPNTAWSSSGIDTAKAGNPKLNPYFSDNVDFGGEWYFSEGGYVGVSLFQKRVTGFTYSSNLSVKFADLPNYGLDTSNLTALQQAALATCGGPNTCTTTVTTKLNVDGSTDIRGSEIVWVQPLDFIVKGLGLDMSATHITQSSTNPLAEVTNISPWSYNLTGFYENEDWSLRMTYYHQDATKAGGYFDSNYDGDPLPARFPIAFARSQLDLSASYNLPFSIGDNGSLVLTFDAYNLTKEAVGDWYGYEGVPNNYYNPGTTYTFGVRGKF